MSLLLRCRGPAGVATLNVELGLGAAAFLHLVAEKTGVPANAIEILSGFPPKLLQLPDSGTVVDLGLASGDMLTVRQGATAEPSQQPAPVTNSTSADTAGQASAAHPSYGSDAAEDEDAMLARAIAASLEHLPGPASSPAPAHTPAGAAAGPGPGSAALRAGIGAGAGRSVTNAVSKVAQAGVAPPSMLVAGGDGSCVVRRVIDSDNSCLFNAVGYVMDRSRSRAAELRKVVAQAVASDPITFNEGFLGKQVDEYCRWIQEATKWGGAIELFIFSQHYGVEVAAFDIRTRRCDIYGQDKGYDTRALLIYDGLHYDALAVAAFEGAPEELDVTMFAPAGRDGAAIMEAAEKLVAATNAARQFTDTANFTLRCAVCQMGLKGEKEAVEHAKTTGHSNFAEY